MEIVAVDSGQLDAAERSALRALWERAFEGDMTEDDVDHAYGGVHVVARDGGTVVAHASAVPRRIRFGGGPWRTIGYVEAVATDPACQGQGIGRSVMARLQDEIAARWPVAMLSTGSATEFYAALGWEGWRGTSYTSTAAGVVADGEEDGLMVLRVDPALVPDLAVDVTCEDRPGDAW